MMTMTTTNVNDPAICVRTRFDRRNVPEEACLSLNIQVILENDVEWHTRMHNRVNNQMC